MIWVQNILLETGYMEYIKYALQWGC